MDILYISSTEDARVNKPIIQALKNLKLTVFDGSFEEQSANKEVKFSRTIREIKKTDGLVVEASSPTFDMGRIMTLAIFQHKPLLILQKKGAKVPLELGANRLVNTKTYLPEKGAELERKVEDFIKAIHKQKLTYRFNLMLSRDINAYLMEQAAEKGISKADYIRSLIVQDMGM